MADPTASRSRIFISYRRQDTEYAVGRLAEDLRRDFPGDQVFHDMASIAPGVKFPLALQQGLETCAAVLVVIGSKWLSITDQKGKRRLDVPGDWVAHEVAESLRQPEVRVFPVLVGVEMPSADDLPESLKPLIELRGHEPTVSHWPNDVAQLIEFLKKVPGLAPTPAPAKPAAGGAESPTKPVAAGPAPPGSRPQAHTPPQQRNSRAPLVPGRVETEAQGGRPKSPPGISIRRGGASVSQPAKIPWKALAAIVAALGLAGVVLFLRKEGPGPIPPTTPTFRDCEPCPEMVVIPAGKVLMGSPEREVGPSSDEGPQHEVAFARPFAVGKFEVTFGEWDACVAAAGCAYKPKDEGWGRGRQPVINVSWEDAQAYASWLAKKTGQPYRLLSEAEWEYAARAGTTTRYPWGDEPGTNRANFDGSGSQWSNLKTAPVGSFEANAFGLHDMIGNAYEWVQDCWNEGYKGAPGDGRAWGSGDCGRRVLRGGSWYFNPENARAAKRIRNEPGPRNYNLGFRVARTL